MFKRKLTISDIFLIVVNLVPLFGVWFEGWDAKMVFLVYCLETVIIGIINILKMATVTLLVKSKHPWQNEGQVIMKNGLFFILFFIAHYGFFVFVQTQIFFAASGIDSSIGFGVYKRLPAILGDHGKLLLLIFITYYTVQTMFSFFGTGQYKSISMMRLMFEPYIRIFVQQFIVIVGSMFLSFGLPKLFVLVVVATKLMADLFINSGSILGLSKQMRERQQE